MSIQRLSNLVFSCPTKGSPQSGIETQLEKIYSVYALSRFLDVSYVHFPFQQLTHFSHIKKKVITEEQAHFYYQLFHIPSDRELPVGGIVYRFPSADLGILCNIRDEAKRNPGSFHFVEITSARSIAEKHPKMLHYIKEVSPFTFPSSSPLKIAIHLQQGELLEPEKALPSSFYLKTVDRLTKILRQLDLPFVCELHIEVTSPRIALPLPTPSFEKMAFTPARAHTHQKPGQEFDLLPNLKKFINDDPIRSLESLATADFLFMSCYSFSYVAALLNTKGLILFHPFLKNPLPGWINATHTDMIDQKIREYIRLKSEG